MLVYGIPEFRLPKAVVKREIDGLEDMGVKFEYNSVVGNMATAEELFEQGFDAIYVATGAGLPNVPQRPRREPAQRLLRERRTSPA